ncbi:MAG: hypothetical protein H0W89_07745 [Candidatus Levybacteria bacterium]|nr:hypothetical protein [Candidatus Levybacteria bacterium]
MIAKKIVKRVTKQKKQTAKFSVKGKVGLLFLLIVSVGFLAYFFAAHAFPKSEDALLSSETETYAAGKPVINAVFFSVEAEDMSYLSVPEGIQLINDTEASGGLAKMLLINTTIVTTVRTEASTSKIVLRAKGNNCHGWPNAVVTVGGAKVMDKNITSSLWKDFSANIALQPGSHSIAITYNNDFESNAGQTCNRNLMIDKVSLQ